jgi:carbon storage regulator
VIGKLVPFRRKEKLCHGQKVRVMLVLSRKQTESVFISDNIVVTVLSILGNKVTLGIKAPRQVPVHRSEVHEAIMNRITPTYTSGPSM